MFFLLWFADPFNSLGTFSSSSIGGPVFHPIDDCEHPILYVPGSGITSHESAISGFFQRNLAGICNGVWVWWLIMGWIPRWVSLWMVHPFLLAPNSLCSSFHGCFVPILRTNEVSTLWSSFFLIFFCFCFANCILGILSFWANIILSVSAYQVTSFVIGLPYSGRYPPDTSICPRISFIH